jgi:hypothetical protein
VLLYPAFRTCRGERIGPETVTYVSNIYKYYVAYLLVQGEYMERRALKQRAPATGEYR